MWKFQRRGCRVYDQRGRKVADVGIGHCDTEQIVERGNLIAAAPELLEALEGIEPHLDAIICYVSTMGEHEPNLLAANVRAAIKSARGQA